MSTRESTPTAIAPSGCLLCLQQSTEPFPAPDARNETPPATSVTDVRLHTDYAGQRGPVAPSGGDVARIIDEVYELRRADTSGTPADYIPEPAAVQPDSFGICPATADGRVRGSGDLGAVFTIRSIAKSFAYALALADRRPWQRNSRPAHRPRRIDCRARQSRLRTVPGPGRPGAVHVPDRDNRRTS
ncbi:glutaminase [Nocardia niigatensis]